MFGRKLKVVGTGAPATDRKIALEEIASETARLRGLAADLDCGMLAYLLAMAEDEARDQLPRNLQLS